MSYPTRLSDTNVAAIRERLDDGYNACSRNEDEALAAGRNAMTMIGREKKGRIAFDYVCECADCDEAGRMVLVAAEQGAVACPGGCGAVYVPWVGPDGHWRLKNVIMPHYGDPERGNYAEEIDDD